MFRLTESLVPRADIQGDISERRLRYPCGETDRRTESCLPRIGVDRGCGGAESGPSGSLGRALPICLNEALIVARSDDIKTYYETILQRSASDDEVSAWDNSGKSLDDI